MGPSRFERESEDPQSPRMARLPYGPAVILFVHIPYVSCYPEQDELVNPAKDKAGFDQRFGGKYTPGAQSLHPILFHIIGKYRKSPINLNWLFGMIMDFTIGPCLSEMIKYYALSLSITE